MWTRAYLLCLRQGVEAFLPAITHFTWEVVSPALPQPPPPRAALRAFDLGLPDCSHHTSPRPCWDGLRLLTIRTAEELAAD